MSSSLSAININPTAVKQSVIKTVNAHKAKAQEKQIKAEKKTQTKLQEQNFPQVGLDNLIEESVPTAKEESAAHWMTSGFSKLSDMVAPLGDSMGKKSKKQIAAIEQKISAGKVSNACVVKEYLTTSGAKKSTEKHLARLDRTLVKAVAAKDNPVENEPEPKFIFKVPFMIQRERNWLPDKSVKLTFITADQDEARSMAEKSRQQLKELSEK